MRENPDPIELFLNWYREAASDPGCNPDVVALATATRYGRPSVRFLYFRGIREGGFSFFTGYESRKGQELLENPFASMAFYWPGPGRQVRVEGLVDRLSSESSDEYWNSRPRESQVSGTVSRQSQPLTDEAAYLAELDRLERSGDPVPRPSNWGGFKIIPAAFEFWTHGEHRRHLRFRFERKGELWSATRLYP
jgi:pyridoxamine 5'-phosphate oxidase